MAKQKKFFAVDLADALGITRFDFNALVQLGEIRPGDEVTQKDLEKIYKKHFGGE
jgi:hypothetical protein